MPHRASPPTWLVRSAVSGVPGHYLGSAPVNRSAAVKPAKTNSPPKSLVVPPTAPVGGFVRHAPVNRPANTAPRFEAWDQATDEQQRAKQQAYSFEAGQAAGQAWKLRAQGVRPLDQVLMARRLTLMGAGMPSSGYLPGT